MPKSNHPQEWVQLLKVDQNYLSVNEWIFLDVITVLKKSFPPSPAGILMWLVFLLL